MRQVRIAELKSRLSEFLRAAEQGESITVLDRNRSIAQIVPMPERQKLRVRSPAASSPPPNGVPLPPLPALAVDVLECLLEERQTPR